MSAIPALKLLKKDCYELEVNLGYTAKPLSESKTKENINKTEMKPDIKQTLMSRLLRLTPAPPHQ